MDIAAHVLYGMTLCSRTGWAGGRKGSSAGHWHRDPTLLAAGLFSILPDAVSMGLPLLVHIFDGAEGNFFMRFGGQDLMYYRCMHSLVIAGGACLLMGLWRRRWLVPALAWPLHVAMDSFSHSDGKFRTTLFYPLTDWGFNGISWWQSGALMATYWAALLFLWMGLFLWRRRS